MRTSYLTVALLLAAGTSAASEERHFLYYEQHFGHAAVICDKGFLDPTKCRLAVNLGAGGFSAPLPLSDMKQAASHYSEVTGKPTPRQ